MHAHERLSPYIPLTHHVSRTGRKKRTGLLDNVETSSYEETNSALERGKGGSERRYRRVRLPNEPQKPVSRDEDSRQVDNASDQSYDEVAMRIRKRREERRRRQSVSEGQMEDMPPNSPVTNASSWQESEWGPTEVLPPEDDDWGWAQPSLGDDFSGRGSERSQRAKGSDRPELEGSEDQEYKGSFRSSSYVPGGSEPDIMLLSPDELDRVLPLVPFSAQASFFNGGAAQAVQRWGASLALTVLLSKAALLAAGTLTWPLWWPWARAAGKNYNLRKQNGYAGLWRTQILEVESRGRPRVQYADEVTGERDTPPGTKGTRFSANIKTTRILLGDQDGAKTEFMLPHDARFDLIRPGEPAEVIVLSESPSFESFKAVKDVYLPECGLWLSEYPYLDRTEFLELSLEIEREVKSETRDVYETEINGEYDDLN